MPPPFGTSLTDGALTRNAAADGDDAERAALERKSARRIRSAFIAVLNDLLPAGTTEQDITPELASVRLAGVWGKVRDEVVRMLTDAALMGARFAFYYTTGELQANEPTLASSWDTVNEEVLRYVLGDGLQMGGGYASELTQQLLATSERQVKMAIAEWVRNGQPLASLTRTLEATVLSRRRAELIATTEVTRAYAEGARLTWAQGGVITTMRWQTARDEGVCPICKPLNQQTAAVVGGVFTVTNAAGVVTRTISTPPAHPGCRCWLSPVAPPVAPAAPVAPKQTVTRKPKTRKPPVQIEEPPAPLPIEPVSPAPRPWLPSMTSAEADEWAAGSVYANDEFYHITKGVEAERSIMREGFDLSRRKFGRVWGDGVYVGLDDDTAQMYQSWTGPGARKLVIKVKVQNPLVIQEPGFEHFNQDYIVSRALNVTRGQATTMLKRRSITEILEGEGYDALRIDALDVEGAVGGRQMIVFNPKNITVVKP
jgi:hypothetical protein